MAKAFAGLQHVYHLLLVNEVNGPLRHDEEVVSRLTVLDQDVLAGSKPADVYARRDGAKITHRKCIEGWEAR
jgi:hypothetical protein